jgi:hypothetical protein
MEGKRHIKTIIHIFYPAVKTATRNLAAVAALILIGTASRTHANSDTVDETVFDTNKWAVFAQIVPRLTLFSSERRLVPMPSAIPSIALPCHKNKVSIKVVLKFRIVESNGWPAYWNNVTIGPVWTASNQTVTGFPNADCPSTPTEQNYSFQMPAYPDAPIKLKVGEDIGLKLFGVAINGVPFDPAANAYWDTDSKNQTAVTQDPSKPTASNDWTFEILTGKLQLGQDRNNAHVQATGAYHYHGMPTGLLEEKTKFLTSPFSVTRSPGFRTMILLGYAADGYPVYSCYIYSYSTGGLEQQVGPGSIQSIRTRELKSSYVLKNGGGTRAAGEPSGWFMQGVPGKAFQSTNYDGTFTQDFVYEKGHGDLDECNGTSGITPEYPDGTYYYVITKDFPFIPRKLKGTPNPSFNVHDQ